MKKNLNRKKPLVALLTNHDDDVYCFRKELIEGMKHAGYQVLVSCPYGEKLSFMKNIGFKYDDVSIDRRGMNPFADLKLFLHYRRMLSMYRPDVVLTYTAKPNVYGSMAAASLKIPYINNVTGLGSVLNKSKMIQIFIMKLFKIAFRRSGCVFFQNKENMLLAQKRGLVEGTCRLIPGSGVNTERYPLQEYPDGGNGIDGNKIVFNYIGRVLHDKGIDHYIEAAKRIRKKYPNTEFNILGFIESTEGHYKNELKELEKQKVIVYRGQQNDVRPYIAKAHAIIHPSVYGEGMSNVLLENASSGRVIITTDNPGCRETVIDGETGFLYHGGDVNGLVEKIEKFLALDNKKRRQMGMWGREHVKKNFSRTFVVDAYLEMIEILVNKKKGELG